MPDSAIKGNFAIGQVEISCQVAHGQVNISGCIFSLWWPTFLPKNLVKIWCLQGKECQIYMFLPKSSEFYWSQNL